MKQGRMPVGKLLGLLLTLAVALAILPGMTVAARAAGDHTHDDTAFTPWTATDSLPAEAGSYCLSSDVTLSATWSAPAGTTSLCLNGHAVKMTGAGSAIQTPSGSTLNLYDCDTTTTHKYAVSDPDAYTGAGLAAVNDSLSGNYETFTGGYITGGNAADGYGGAINVTGGTLNVSGCTLIGNAAWNGGAVSVGSMGSGGQASFNGTAMIGNVGNDSQGYGGAVFVQYDTASATLKNCAVSKNRAAYGGGIAPLGGASLTLESSSVRQNGCYVNIAGIFGDNSVITVRGNVQVNDNVNAGYPNNLYLQGENAVIAVDGLSADSSIAVLKYDKGIFTRSPGAQKASDLIACFASDNAFSVVKDGDELKLERIHVHGAGSAGEISFVEWTATDSLPAEAGSYCLSSDVTLSATWSAPAGATSLCLNGHAVKMTGAGSAIQTPSGSTLNLYDCDTTTHKYAVSDPDAYTGAGLAAVNDELSGNYETFTGGYITGGNAADGYGGAINVTGGALNVSGCTLIGNAAWNGGAVSVGSMGSGGQASFNGTAMIGNVGNDSQGYGGAVFVQYDTAGATLKNCSVSKNRAAYGGGIAPLGGASLTLESSSVRQNGCYVNIAGIFGDNSVITVRGNVQVNDNVNAGYPNNLFLQGENAVIAVDGLSADSSIAVLKYDKGIFTRSPGTQKASDLIACFASDNAFSVVKDGDELKLDDVHIHSFTYAAGTGENANSIIATCAAAGCDLDDGTEQHNHTAVLTISAPEHAVYGDGKSAEATIADANGIRGDAAIVYRSGAETLNAAPTDEGDYTASITLGEATAMVAYTVAPRPIAASADDVTVTYDGAAHGIAVVVTDPASGAQVRYGTAEDACQLEASPTATSAGTLTVFYTVTAPHCAEYTGSATVTINKAPSTAAAVAANDRAYDGTAQPLVTVDAAALIGGTMRYALGGNGAQIPESAWSDGIPTAADAGEYTVHYKVVGDENHLDTEPGAVTARIGYRVTVAQADHGAVTADRAIALKGETVALAAAPSEGYILDALTAVDASGAAIPVNDNAFTMPGAHVTVTATFKLAPHDVTVAPAENGSVTADRASADRGDAVRLTATPDFGFALNTLTAADASGAAVPVTDSAFTMPGADVTVTATFRALPVATLPARLTSIGEEAFAGIAATCVRVTDKVTAIGARAFAGCPNLLQIAIPASVKTIADSALAGCANVTVYGRPGTEAQRFAQANGFGFVDIDAR